jgi:hypothetical protein
VSEEEIASLMAGEIAREACETVAADSKARCEAVLRRILFEGKGFELLNELSELNEKAVKEKLRELVARDEFTVKVASKPEEIKALLETGFEYICEKDGLMFFRKRK